MARNENYEMESMIYEVERRARGKRCWTYGKALAIAAAIFTSRNCPVLCCC
jgi:hypothetical protein